MKVTFTNQQVIDMGVALYATEGVTRATIRKWLEILLENKCAEFDIETMFDIIVG
jgi:hypothetical protein